MDQRHVTKAEREDPPEVPEPKEVRTMEVDSQIQPVVYDAYGKPYRRQIGFTR